MLSGAAAIVDQTAWQRALIVYVAGSEAMSSMIVVLVFMAGLGAGALWLGRTADRISNPGRALALVELLLAMVSLLIIVLLAFDPGEGARRLQQTAVAIGMPLWAVSVSASSAVLLAPCFLIGMTSPLLSETVQRQLQAEDNRVLVVLFFGNTLGSLLGGLATGFLLLPLLGQRGCLAIAVVLNATAAALMLGLASRAALPPAPEAGAPRPPVPLAVRGFAFAFGVLALAYEMYLYRVVAVTFEPKPYTFATVLCAYLLFWAAGVLAARWVSTPLVLTLLGTAGVTLLAPLLAGYPWPHAFGWRHALFAAGFWLPCAGFGIAFGQLVIRVAVHWGHDVGQFLGSNTIGSCCGVVLGVLVGYEVHPTYLLLAITVGYLALAIAELPSAARSARERTLALVGTAAVLGLGTTILALQVIDQRAMLTAGGRMYFDPEGVIEVRGGRSMFWNGLGHAPLSHANSHIGDHNWLLGAMPLLAHAPGRDLQALVVGLGGGTTVGTLARSSSVRTVDVYDLEPDLKKLLADFPDGTLNVGTNPKVRMFWQDGRTGLALSEARYDVLTQQPLYLKQAGSSILLSKEYFQLVRSRMKPGAVYCIYSNAEGHVGQSLIVRRTAREVFPYGQSILKGYLLLVSEEPVEVSVASIEHYLASASRDDVLAREVRSLGVQRLASLVDQPRLDWEGSSVLVTDDRPVVEYPAIADWFVARFRTRSRERLH